MALQKLRCEITGAWTMMSETSKRGKSYMYRKPDCEIKLCSSKIYLATKKIHI